MQAVTDFIPIALDDYIPKHLAANPGAPESDVRERLTSALAAHKSGVRCDCGSPIWVIGAAEAGYSCFTCITGEGAPDDDYELLEALPRE